MDKTSIHRINLLKLKDELSSHKMPKSVEKKKEATTQKSDTVKKKEQPAPKSNSIEKKKDANSIERKKEENLNLLKKKEEESTNRISPSVKSKEKKSGELHFNLKQAVDDIKVFKDHYKKKFDQIIPEDQQSDVDESMGENMYKIRKFTNKKLTNTK